VEWNCHTGSSSSLDKTKLEAKLSTSSHKLNNLISTVLLKVYLRLHPSHKLGTELWVGDVRIGVFLLSGSNSCTKGLLTYSVFTMDTSPIGPQVPTVTEGLFLFSVARSQARLESSPSAASETSSELF
jgi:hypothetical protein